MGLDMLRQDVQFMKTRYSLDVPGKSEGRLVIRYEQSLFVPTAADDREQERNGINSIHHIGTYEDVH